MIMCYNCGNLLFGLYLGFLLKGGGYVNGSCYFSCWVFF